MSLDCGFDEYLAREIDKFTDDSHHKDCLCNEDHEDYDPDADCTCDECEDDEPEDPRIYDYEDD